MDLGLMYLRLCGHRRKPAQNKKKKMMTVFGANCVHTVLGGGGTCHLIMCTSCFLALLYFGCLITSKRGC